VLAVVDHDQREAVTERGDQGVASASPDAFGDTDGIGYGGHDHRRVGDPYEVGEGDPVGVLGAEVAGDCQAQAGLADPARTVCGPNSLLTRDTVLAGKPPRRACSNTVSTDSVSWTQ
jgi:hypothetical protein